MEGPIAGQLVIRVMDDEINSRGRRALHSAEKVRDGADSLDAGTNAVVDGTIGGEEGWGEVSRDEEGEWERVASC